MRGAGGRIAAGLIVTVLGVGLSFANVFAPLNRLGHDALLAVHDRFADAADADRRIALVVIDEVTHRAAPFSETPEVAWTPYLADALDAIADQGATAIGLDVVYPKTLATPDLLPGYDRPLLQSFARLGRSGRLVLGEVRLSEETIAPYAGQVLAAGADNVRPLQFTPDPDGVIRSYPASFPLDGGGRVSSFANELAARANGAMAAVPFLIDFPEARTIPVYRLSDIRTCTEDGAPLDAFFDNRIVLMGTWLDVEDRHMAANRFQQPNQPAVTTLPCGGVSAGREIDRQSVPGVFIHAAALKTILNGSAPLAFGRVSAHLAALAGLALLAAGFLTLSPVQGLLLLGATVAGAWLAAAIAFARADLILPAPEWSALALGAYLLLVSYRVFFEDQQKRWIRHAFRHYLSPALVDDLAAHPERLKLGGERRPVAVMFLDLAGFTSLSERLQDRPEDLVRILNEALGRFAEEIERQGGFVDKFIGDAVMGVWGAPATGDNDAQAAARTALLCRKAMQAGGKELSGLRIGLSCGDAIAGNMGAAKRFNYTVVGDTVNLASRLETANKIYGTEILATEAVAAALDDTIVTRAIDRVRVAGKTAPVTLVEVVGFSDEVNDATRQRLSAFEAARAHYVNGDFETAAREFAKIADDDPVARVFAARARRFAAEPPPDGWDGVTTLAADKSQKA